MECATSEPAPDAPFGSAFVLPFNRITGFRPVAFDCTQQTERDFHRLADERFRPTDPLARHFLIGACPWVIPASWQICFPWDEAPRYLLHNRDHAFAELSASVKATGIEDVITAPHTAWQNPFVGAIRGICASRVFRPRDRVEFGR